MLFKALIASDTFHKDGSPHLMATVIECEDIGEREEKYKDIIGFYTFIPKAKGINKKIINYMNGWTEMLGKSTICLLKTNEELSGWLFEYGEFINHRKIQVFTSNDINYDIWLDPDINFWNPVDFLLDAEYYTPMDEDYVDEKFKKIEESLKFLDNKMSKILGIIERLDNDKS